MHRVPTFITRRILIFLFLCSLYLIHCDSIYERAALRRKSEERLAGDRELASCTKLEAFKEFSLLNAHRTRRADEKNRKCAPAPKCILKLLPYKRLRLILVDFVLPYDSFFFPFVNSADARTATRIIRRPCSWTRSCEGKKKKKNERTVSGVHAERNVTHRLILLDSSWLSR